MRNLSAAHPADVVEKERQSRETGRRNLKKLKEILENLN